MTADRSAPRGRALRSESRRAEILQAAMSVIAERGYRGASLSAVAERVGMTQQGLLHYFPTREALLIAVLEARDEWDTGGTQGGAHAWPLEMWTLLVDYNTTRSGVVQTFSALLGESVTDNQPAREYFAQRYVMVRERAAATLRHEFGERLPGGLTPEEAAPLVVAVMDGMQFQWLLDPDSADMSAAFRHLIALLGEERPQGG
ncbi:helix-turn-helix domain-containing protein [Saccharopolyspora sp. NPDC002686]|uniref:TetR/AcrR family transcriptional regulator n=1 Tax=Saccharopolyspora sp. NPDC002686 TaxID=3154541 RepID=UPI0033212395